MDAPTNNTDTNAPGPVVVNSVKTPAQWIKDQLEAAGKAELEALKPQVAAIVRAYVKSWEDAHTSGMIGMVERKVVDAVVDSIFGPAPTV